ncbi:peptide-methionine (S)-S-oxide reductase MsrA [Providencia rettgeri]|uniref:peptide-methionine (S)-S-oxide reductase MsrA n=1 Tax=Providencia rettgeri TaxID=587 RepID=UPI00384EFD3B
MSQEALQQATFGAGCFWGAEAAFQTQNGVLNSRVGYARSADETSPWIEVVQVDFDPLQTSYDELLSLFWKIHNPQSIDKQGNNVGEKYRSAVFTHSIAQANQAIASKKLLEQQHYQGKPVATVIVTFVEFQLADEKDQHYVQKHGAGACSI